MGMTELRASLAPRSQMKSSFLPFKPIEPSASARLMTKGMSTLVDIPFVIKRALAEGSIGLNGKKLLFIWLRGANDALNSVIPIQDTSYATSRPTLGIPKDPGTDYAASGLPADFPINALSTDATYSYANAIR